MHCARAVHVQMFFSRNPLAATTSQKVGTADARRAGHMYATTTYLFLWLPFLYDAGCARQDRTSEFERVLRF